METQEQEHRVQGATPGAARVGAEPVLQVSNLEVQYPGAPVVRGVSFRLKRGEAVAIVGESGAGKTQTLYAVLGLHMPQAVYRGTVLLAGRDMTSLSEADAAKVRGREVGMVFQNPGPYLNPARRVGSQIAETVRVHTGVSREAAQRRVAQVLEQVELAPETAQRFPHQLSGGMQQRAMIALALSCAPELLLMDEPTSALDAPIRRRHIALLAELRRELGLAVLVVTHDLEVVQDIAERVLVMYCGKIIEEGAAHDVLRSPRHPYTELLLGSAPSSAKRGRRLKAIGGDAPPPSAVPAGCSFHPRCPLAQDICRKQAPELQSAEHCSACFFADRLPLSSRTTANGDSH